MGDGIELLIINTESPCAISLFNQQYWREPWTGTLSNNFLLEHFLDFCSQRGGGGGGGGPSTLIECLIADVRPKDCPGDTNML